MDSDPQLIRVSRLHYPVTTLGYGRRAGVWVQGCTIGCRGCIARDTWDSAQGFSAEVTGLVERIAGLVQTHRLDGVTISGGEPFEQPEALQVLVAGISENVSGLAWPVDLLCYSGMAESRLKKRFPHVLERLDALIPEPFMESQNDSVRLRGSANQRVVCLSELGIIRYSQVDADSQPRGIQVSIEGGQVWMIGIPRRGDLDRVAAMAAVAGVDLEGVTWRA